MKLTRKIAYSGMVMALYIVLVFVTQSFAFGQYQIRLSTAVYALAYSNAYLIVPLGLANMLSNLLMGGLGIFDIVGGLVIGILTAGGVYLLGRVTTNPFILVLPIALFPSFIVPIWLSIILGVPYWVLVASLLVGQIISAYTLGLFFVKSKVIRQILNPKQS